MGRTAELFQILIGTLRGCLHDTRGTFAPELVHSGSLSWLYIYLHDTTTKCHAGTSHPSMSSQRLLCGGENFTPVRNLAMVSCRRKTTQSFGGYLSCQIFLMTFVNQPDKELRSITDSVSFSTDNIGSNVQRNRKKSVPNWSASVWPDADIWTRSLT